MTLLRTIPTMKGHIWTLAVGYWHMELSHCQCVSIHICQYAYLGIYHLDKVSTCKLVNVSICQVADSPVCHYDNLSMSKLGNLSICQFAHLSMCQSCTLLSPSRFLAWYVHGCYDGGCESSVGCTELCVIDWLWLWHDLCTRSETLARC